MLIYRDVVLPEADPHAILKHGRKIEHDSRSWNYAQSEALPGHPCWQFWRAKPKPKTVMWEPSVPALDQGNTGSCTGNAGAHLLATECPGHHALSITETDARVIYSAATKIDGFAGQWPPDDTGSSGLAIMKVLKRMNYVSAYRHCFSVNSVITALQTTPVITGIAWREDMYNPDSTGFVQYTGPVVGGHEFEVIGYNVEDEVFSFRNSWGRGWGDDGDFHMEKDQFALALKNHGDVQVPVWKA